MTDGLLGFATAAHLWGTIDSRPDQVHVVIAHSKRLYPPSWVRLHRVPVPPEAQTTQRALPITGRTWTLLDYLPTLHRTDASRLADRSLQRQWLTTRDIERRLRITQDAPATYGSAN